MPEDGVSVGALTDVTIRETSPPPDRTVDPVVQVESAADDLFLKSSGGLGEFSEFGLAVDPTIVSAFPSGAFTDNVVLRGHNDGGGGAAAQGSGVIVNDSDDISGLGTITCGSGLITIVSAIGNLLLNAIEQGGAADGQGLTWDNAGGNWVPDDVATQATSPIVLTGDIISHANSGVVAGTYTSLTVDIKGHVTGGTNPGHVTGSGIDNRIVLWNGASAIDASSFTILVNQLLAPNGTAALPSLRVGTEESGFHRPALNQLGLVVAGVNRITFTATAIIPQVSVYIKGQSGLVSDCAFSYFAATSTGYYRPSGSITASVSNGVESVRHTNTAAKFNNSNANRNFEVDSDTTNNAQVLDANGGNESNGFWEDNVPRRCNEGFGPGDGTFDTELIDANGEITITDSQHAIAIDGAGSPDNLDAIIGGFAGQEIILRGIFFGDTIVVRSAQTPTSGVTIWLTGLGNVTLSAFNATLILRLIAGVWVEVSGSG